MSDIEQDAIKRLELASEMSMKLYRKPLVITYSGGKDSDVLLRLAEVSKIQFEVLHNLTTADAPETVRHVRKAFRRLEEKGVKCVIDRHTKPDGTFVTMWNLIPKRLMPPTRIARYCCAELKEGGGKGRFIATGVRWAESTKRKKNRGNFEVLAPKRKDSLILANDNDEDRRLFETCQLKGKRVVNPIIDWRNEEVLDCAKSEHIQLNPLYCEGFRRVGCIGCPMAGKARTLGFARYPKIKAAYIRAFDRMLDERKRRGLATEWQTGADVFHWWMEDGAIVGQQILEGFEE